MPQQDQEQGQEQEDQELHDLEQLLDRLEDAAREQERLSLDDVMDAIGRRSFGPIILFAGIITVLPIVGDVPGVPTIMGVVVLLTAGQLLFHHDHFWLPKWLLKRSVSTEKFCKALGWMRKPARFIDRIIRPRMQALVHRTGTYVVAVACVLIALATPAMEFVPFSANGAGAALMAFGLALIAHDGLLALIALFVTAGTFGLVIYNLV